MRWLKEPLVHFLLIGAALFVLYDRFGADDTRQRQRIVVDAGRVEQLATLWSKRWQRPPTPAELDGLVDAYIREEVLYREAVALGLERDDTIVRRRLAQKMEFLINDLAVQDEPGDEELRSFLAENAGRFREPPRFTFMHVYLSRDRRGADARGDAQRLLDVLQAQGPSADPTRIGDAFMLGYRFADRSARDIAGMFGERFSESLSGLSSNRWQGPIESGYGLHLVFIDAHAPARLPELEEIRARVRSELLAERRKKTDDAVYRELRDRYEIVVERPE
jgi:hypothetical protein